MQDRARHAAGLRRAFGPHTMNILHLKKIRQHAPAIAVMLVCCFLTVLAFLSEQVHQRERTALHASADAAEFESTLQQGVDSYIRLNRSLAAHFTAAPPAADPPGALSFQVYMKAADVLRQNPGLGYIGYIERIGHGQFVPAAGAAGADPEFAYPYRYAYPDDVRARRAKNVDFATIPQRWEAMERARDSGQTTATAKHRYVSDSSAVPIVMVFTPIYDPALPSTTVAERRLALRGFVFSIYEVEELIERVMGRHFQQLFDLEVFDGAVDAQSILYDGDHRPHVLMRDADMTIARHANVEVAGRIWQLFFYPKPIYVGRYYSWSGAAILALGFAMSCALAFLMRGWTRRALAREREETDALQFDAMFDDHPTAVYALDAQRRFVNANAQALKELQVSKADLIGKSVEQFIVPERQELARGRFEHALRGNAVSYDSAVVAGDGSRIETNVIMIPVTVGGEVTGVLGIGQNITAKKLSEWRLRESKKMLQLVIDHLPQRVFWKDTQFRFLGCNAAVARDAGLDSPEDLIGRTDFELAWHASAEQYRQDDMATLGSGVAKINYEEEQRRADGSSSWLRTSKIPLADMDGSTVALLGMYEDITDRKELENRLREMAHYDGLTGLANRAFFHNQLQLAISRARRSDSVVALMYFDIDHFKTINDTLGHDAGDALLKAFAQRVGATVRDVDLFARLGGDEFALLLEGLPNRQAADQVAAKLVGAMQAPFRLGAARTVQVSTSIGLAFLEPSMRADDLVRSADQAMYHAKREGRNRFETAPSR
jgi:diguanylate cyclase (GGDEF)-like protein/PAS domain S-box-containing protein